MSAAEYYNVGPDYHQQNPASAQQAYQTQAYPQHPQPVRLSRAPHTLEKTLIRDRFLTRAEPPVDRPAF